MHFAKPAMDVGLFTEHLDAHLAFWGGTMGLPAESPLKLGDGIHQHRFLAGDSVIKVNHSRRPLEIGGSGLRGITLTREYQTVPRVHRDPEGRPLAVLPSASWNGVDLVIHLEVSDLRAHHRFWREVIQLDARDVHQFACGRTLIDLSETGRPSKASSWKSPGWSYMTLQVRECAIAHLEALRNGASEGEPPRRIGDAAVISFIRGPDGNFIELSQKASLVGALAESPRHTASERALS
jgi:lactoylglutathione lyase